MVRQQRRAIDPVRPKPPGLRKTAARTWQIGRRAGMMFPGKRKDPEAANFGALKIRVRTDGTAGRRRSTLEQKDTALDNPTPRTPSGQPGRSEPPCASSARPFPSAWSPSRPGRGRS